jgi:hypothetical protein
VGMTLTAAVCAVAVCVLSTEFKRREATFKRREEMLKQKDLALQESLIKFNKFLQENDSKRTRADKKRVDEAKQKTQKEGEIQRLLGEVERQKEVRAQMEEEVKKMSQYQAYLDRVLEAEEEYPEIVDLLSRYETLHAANDDLIQRLNAAARENEEERVLLQTTIREKSDEILEQNSEIAEKKKDLEHAAADVLEAQDESDRQMQTVGERTLQLGQVIMACENIFARCKGKSNTLKRRKEPKWDEKLDDADVLIEKLGWKLGLIEDYVKDLQWITRNAKPVSTPATRADGVAPGGASPTNNPTERSSGGAGASTGIGPKSFTDGGRGSIRESRGPRESRGGHHGMSMSKHSVSTGSEGGF